MMLNAMSLALGVLAWSLGLAAVTRRGCKLCSILSFTCCGAALLAQLLEVRRRVALEDWSSLMDTMDAVVFAGVMLLSVTVLLNLISLTYKKSA